MGKRERGGRWVENPEEIGDVSDPNFVRLPDARSLFAARADRFLTLADGHPLGDYLRFLSSLARAQHRAACASPEVPPPDPDLLATRIGAEMPPLAPDLLVRDVAGFAAALGGVLAALDAAALPDAAREAAERVAVAPPADIAALAETLLMGSYPADRLGEAVFVAAALQVFLARHAAMLPGERLRPVGDGVCPACGSAPVASMIVSFPGASRTRYCACSLCQTLWNYVRIKCTSCGSTEKIAYFSADEIGADAAVETCGVCRCYIKHIHKDRVQAMDPVADDVASFGLDLLIREDDFRPGGVNPLFIAT